MSHIQLHVDKLPSSWIVRSLKHELISQKFNITVHQEGKIHTHLPTPPCIQFPSILLPNPLSQVSLQR